METYVDSLLRDIHSRKVYPERIVLPRATWEATRDEVQDRNRFMLPTGLQLEKPGTFKFNGVEIVRGG